MIKLQSHQEDKRIVAIINYGVGNTFSIVNACESVGVHTVVTNDIETIKNADGIILPGVGSFAEAMNALHKQNLVDLLKELVLKQGKPLLGVCLGMQLLFEESEEFGKHQGLGLLKGHVRRLNPGAGYKVPIIGWQKLIPGQRCWDSSLFNNLSPGDWMYFMHSFCTVPDEKQHILSTTQYGDENFCSAVQNGNICGVQFHPEKSAQFGLSIYKNFTSLFQQDES